MRQCLYAALAWLALVIPIHSAEPTAASPIRLALVSDPHVTRGTNEDQAHHKARFSQVIAEVNMARVAVVLIAGDLTQDGKAQEMADFQEQIKTFTAPVWFVPGNHDVGNKFISGQTNQSGVTEARVRSFEQTLGPSFFVRERPGLRVIGLNSPILGSGFPREEAMWEFLEKELAKPKTPPTVLFTHYPLFVAAADEKGGDYWNVEPVPRLRLLALLQRGGVRTVLSGHLHRELIVRENGMTFATTPPVSFGLPKGKQPEGWTLVTLPAEGDAQIEFQHLRAPPP